MNKEQFRLYRHNQRVWNNGEEQHWTQHGSAYFKKIPYSCSLETRNMPQRLAEFFKGIPPSPRRRDSIRRWIKHQLQAFYR